MLENHAQSRQYRSAQAQDSGERYRALFLQEQGRARHLSLINEVQKCALSAREAGAFLHQVCRAIQSHFSDCDVNIYLSNLPPGLSPIGISAPFAARGQDSEIIVVASAGEHGFAAAEGEKRGADSLAGRAAQTQRTQYHDLNAEYSHSEVAPIREAAPIRESLDDEHWPDGELPADGTLRSGMCVPIVAGGRALGAICMESARENAIESRDAVALQTAAAIIASHLEAGRMFEEMRELSAFNQTLINSMAHSLMTCDRDGFITLVNERLCQTLGLSRDELLMHPMELVFGDKAERLEDLREAIAEVTSSGVPHELPEIQLRSPEGTQVFDVRLFRVYFRGEAQAVLLLINLTRRWRMFRQLQIMNEIGRLFGASLDINQVLHTVLTCVTAGAGLGFNRAFLLLRGEDGSTQAGVLKGAMALGPSSSEEAGRVWRELGSRDLSLADILEYSAPLDQTNLTPLQEQMLQLEIGLHNPCFPALSRAVSERRALCVRRDELLGAMNEMTEAICGAQQAKAREVFTSGEIAIAPLLAKNRVVGVILADNLYSGAPIEPDDVQLLDALAQQAGLTLANALAYQALHSAQRELVSAERLAAVGEMAARVSHEIRNPLATVGGFARSISKNPNDAAGVARKTGIIVDEVARLEELLNDLVDMARPRARDLQAHSINALVAHAILLADSDIQAHKVQVEKNFDEALPPILMDRSRVLQAILNIVRNGAQAMAEGGVLRIATRRSEGGQWMQIEIHDEGSGISGHALKHVFDPFFSTKLKGSGLGLAITRRIIQDHDGEIDVFSEPDEGTKFVLNLPFKTAPE